jgi:hypothetical protein
MTVTKNEFGQQNMFATEPTMYITEEDMARYEEQTHNEKAEIWNSRTAMMGVIVGFVSYALTGNLFFGLY